MIRALSGNPYSDIMASSFFCCNRRYSGSIISCWRVRRANSSCCPGMLDISRFPAEICSRRDLIRKSYVLDTFSMDTSMPFRMFSSCRLAVTTRGLFRLDPANRRLRSTTSSLYCSMPPMRPTSFNPRLAGIISCSEPWASMYSLTMFNKLTWTSRSVISCL